MKAKGKNVSNLRVDNRRLILEYLNEVGESSRIKIAKELGLTKASLTIMVNQMMEEGIVVETGEVDTGRVGRKEVHIAINPEYGKVLGISLEKNVIDVTLADIKADVIDHCECNTENYLDRLNSILENNGDIKLIGITYVGNDKKQAKELAAYLQEKLLIPIFIEHNVAALTEAHHYISHAKDFIFIPGPYFIKIKSFISHAKDFIFIKYGPGIGSAVVLNGDLIENIESGIGNVIVGEDRLEDLISYKAFENRFDVNANDSISSKVISDIIATNATFKKEVVSAIKIVMRALRNASEFIGVKKVVIYGYVLNQEQIFDEILKVNNGYLDISLTPLVDNKISIGAVYHALYQGFLSKGGII